MFSPTFLYSEEDNSVVLVNGSRTVDCRTQPKSHPGNVDMEMSPQLHYQSENTEDGSSDSGLAAIVKQELSDNNGPVSNGYYPDLEQPSTVHEPRTAQREEDTSASRGEAWGATSPPKPLRFLLQQSNSVVDQPCYIPKPPALHRAADPTNSPEVGCNTLSPTASGSGTITPATQRVEFRTFENYKCNYCDFTSNTRNGRIMHTRSMHKEKIKRSRRMCKICKDEFANSSNYHRHLRRIHNRNHSLQHCSECNYESADADTFQSHMISTHPSRQPNNFVALPDTHTKIHLNPT